VPEFEIIIPSREGAHLLREQWETVACAASAIGAVICVVLDGPDPEAENFLKDRARIVRLPVASGFGTAVNAGVGGSTADRVILLNNDVLPETLLGFAGPWSPDEFARTGACMNERLGRDESPSRWTIEQGILRVIHPCANGESPPKAGSPIAHAHGGASSFCRMKWNELGGFSPAYGPAYGEDVDLSFRAWKRGWRVSYCPGTRMTHRSSATTGDLFTAEWREFLAERHRLLFLLTRVSDLDLLRSRDRAFARILSSGFLQFDLWRLKRPLLWALSRHLGVRAEGEGSPKQPDLSDREAILRSGSKPSIFDGLL